MFDIRVFIIKERRIKNCILSTILILALILRLQPSTQETTRGGFGPFGDSFLYHNIAYNLYMGNGFSGTPDERAYGINKGSIPTTYESTVTRGPVYPVFLSIIYKLSNGNNAIPNWQTTWRNVRIAQSVLDASVCLVIYFIVGIIIPSSSIPAIICSVLYCFSFFNIYYTKALLTESITTFLLAIFLLSLIKSLRHFRNNRYLVQAGIIMGLVCLSRPEYVLFIPLCSFMLYCYFHRYYFQNIKKPVLFLVTAAIIIFPWTVRNYLVFKKPIIISASGLGYSLFCGTFEDGVGQTDKMKIPKKKFAEKQKIVIETLLGKYKEYFYNGSMRIKEVDDEFMQIAFDEIKSDPLEVSKAWIKKIPKLWYHKYTTYNLEPKGIYFGFYFVLSFAAIWFGKKEEKKLMLPIIILFIYISIIFLPLHVEPRYGAPVMPGIISITGIGIWKIKEKVMIVSQT